MSKQNLQYAGSEGELLTHDTKDDYSRHITTKYILATADIKNADDVFTIGTTHFTWSAGGKTADLQREDIKKLLQILKEQSEIVFCGDFNAPRGEEIFSALAARYKDNVPPEYSTSIDGTLHKAGPLPYMVDGLFSTPAYNVFDVEMVSGVSDHCALVATISKN